MTPDLRWRPRAGSLSRSRAVVALALLAIAASMAMALFLRNSRLTVPLVMGDEYYYSRQADPHYSRTDIQRTRQHALPRTLILAL